MNQAINRRSTRGDRVALALSGLAVLAAYLVADRVFERMPHIEDEIAIVWQAQVIADGELTVPSPPFSKHFLVPFVVDHRGERFGKYPLGWPVLLSLGVRWGARALVNPLLAGLGVWLTYRLGKRLMGEWVGLLAAGLTLGSPFFLINSGTLLSHPMGLALSAAFSLGWLDALDPGRPARYRRLGALMAGLGLGMLALTRPLTAVGVGLPFGIHGVYRLVRGDRHYRRHVLTVGFVALALSSLHFVWQAAVTGDPWLNPYTLWWSYDRVGFGPGVGRTAGGHTLDLAWLNTRFSLRAGWRDLFGWGRVSWIFLPAGLWAARKNRAALLVSSVFFSLVAVYMLYWVGSWVYGPRYYYEGLYSLILLSAAGVASLAGWPLRPGDPLRQRQGMQRWRPLAVTALLALLLTAGLVFYTPIRLGGMREMNGFSRSHLAPFLTPEAQALTPALIIVHPFYWTAYGTLLELEDPDLSTPFIFAMSRGPRTDEALAASQSERQVFHYYPEQPYVFYKGAR